MFYINLCERMINLKYHVHLVLQPVRQNISHAISLGSWGRPVTVGHITHSGVTFCLFHVFCFTGGWDVWHSACQMLHWNSPSTIFCSSGPNVFLVSHSEVCFWRGCSSGHWGFHIYTFVIINWNTPLTSQLPSLYKMFSIMSACKWMNKSCQLYTV